MNNFQAKLRLDEINTSYTQEGKMIVNGTASFKFFDREEKVAQLRFVAYGNAAVDLNASGVGSLHVVSGRLNVYPPTDSHPNHQLVLSVNHALAIAPGNAAPTVIYPAPAAVSPQPVATVGSANGNTAPYNTIPF